MEKKTSKRVAFVKGVAPPKETNLALSISKHEAIENHVEYCVIVWSSGLRWVLRKRYKDFETLHKNMTAELGIRLPQLPKKRWLQSKRWINRWYCFHDQRQQFSYNPCVCGHRLDTDYCLDRRQQLEIYARALLRVENILHHSRHLKKFLEVESLPPPNSYEIENLEYEAFKEHFTARYAYDDEVTPLVSPVRDGLKSSMKLHDRSLSMEARKEVPKEHKEEATLDDEDDEADSDESFNGQKFARVSIDNENLLKKQLEFLRLETGELEDVVEEGLDSGDIDSDDDFEESQVGSGSPKVDGLTSVGVFKLPAGATSTSASQQSSSELDQSHVSP